MNKRWCEGGVARKGGKHLVQAAVNLGQSTKRCLTVSHASIRPVHIGLRWNAGLDREVLGLDSNTEGVDMQLWTLSRADEYFISFMNRCTCSLPFPSNVSNVGRYRGPHSCYSCFTWMYLECACCLWKYRLPGFSLSSSCLYPWVTSPHFLEGNTEAELKPTTFSSLLLFVFSCLSSPPDPPAI